jgi:hypothetical protein
MSGNENSLVFDSILDVWKSEFFSFWLWGINEPEDLKKKFALI